MVRGGPGDAENLGTGHLIHADASRVGSASLGHGWFEGAVNYGALCLRIGGISSR